MSYPKVEGLSEQMPNGVVATSDLYLCDSCRNAAKTVHHTCQVNSMLPVLLIMSNHRFCPLHNKTEKEIEEWRNQNCDD